MKKLIISILLLLTFQLSFGQDSQRDSSINSFILNLKKDKVKTVCLYKMYSGGEYVPSKAEDRCGRGRMIPVYIFWYKRGKSYMTKRDNCFDYAIYEIKDNTFWHFYFKNQDIIKKEKIKPFACKVIVKGVDTTVTPHVADGSSESMTFIDETGSLTQIFSFDYDQKQTSEMINVNFENNVNSKTHYLKGLVDSLTTEFYKNKVRKTRRP